MTRKLSLHLTTSGRGNPAWMQGAEELLRAAGSTLFTGATGYLPAASAEQADLIVFLEPEFSRLRPYLGQLAGDAWIARRPNDCFVIDCSDMALGLLPGVYPNLRRSQFRPDRLRPGGFLRDHNPWVARLAEQREEIRPVVLGSFQGADSAPVRRALLSVPFTPGTIEVTPTRGWYNHPEASQRHYAESILRSRFVLCPRGHGPSTHRLFETLQLGRAPVILSDDWVPPEGPRWEEFSLRLPEARVGELECFLRDRAEAAEAMGRLARKAWEEWFSPKVRYLRALETIEAIRRARRPGHREQEYHRWSSFRLHWSLGWTLPQCAVRHFRDGTLGAAVRRRIRKKPRQR